MKFNLIFVVTLILTGKSESQTLRAPNCDSVILTKKEFEICKNDSIYKSDISYRIEYITFLKTELLPKYRFKRISLNLPVGLSKDLMLLKQLYDSTLTEKTKIFMRDMDRNQKYLSPLSYVNSLLAFETFRIYPDVYAILINPIHLELNPKTTTYQQDNFNRLVSKIYMLVTEWNDPSIVEIAKPLTKEKRQFSKSLDMFQGVIDEEERYAYDIINFLLWTE